MFNISFFMIEKAPFMTESGWSVQYFITALLFFTALHDTSLVQSVVHLSETIIHPIVSRSFSSVARSTLNMIYYATY